uniref:Glycosyl transferase family 1 domain-containing protein n=1 Tax=Cucumis sativus TaxID=3659 RepID=A0A0A0KWP4_CUCSA
MAFHVCSIMVEPFCSVPLIWIIQDDMLSKRLNMYKDRGWENLVSHWRSTFSRASVVVFPNFALPQLLISYSIFHQMLYSALDTGNFHVIQGSPVDVWSAEIYKKTHFKHELGNKLGFDVEDIVVLVVGSSFYNELSPEYAVALNRMGPVLTKLPRKNPEVSFKFVFLCGNSTNRCNDALQETASRLGLPSGYLSHYGFDQDVNGILYFADIVLYESAQNVQDFPSLLIRAMTFEVPIVAPDLPIINQYVGLLFIQVIDGFHGLLFPKFSSDALISALTDLTSTSDGRLTMIANSIASSGRLLAKNILASECVTGYANLLKEVLNFPSDVVLPSSITRLPKAVWEWDLFWNELIQVPPNEQRSEKIKRKSSVVIKLEEEFSDLVSPLNISSPGKEISAHDIPTQQDWDIIEEIELIEEYDRVEMEELQERTESILGSWEQVYRIARKSDRIKLEKEKDEEELERAGQIVCIYEIYNGPGAWPFLHHAALFRGLSLSPKALRLKSDDVSAPQRLPLLKSRFYQDILCEIGGMFAIANNIDTIHRTPWIGFQSWQADGRKVSLSKKAGQVLEEAIQENTGGEVIYFWAYLDVGFEVIDSDDSPFWQICDIFNRGHCRSTFKDAFRHMYGLPRAHLEALPPMPDDGDLWSSLHSWVMPTPTFLEFIMFSRMFVDSIDAVNGNLSDDYKCLLASSGLERRQCYCRMLEMLINVWAYHSGRRMVYLNPRSGSLEEQHPLEERQDFMWSKFFNITLLKTMDADLAEAANDGDHSTQNTWLWPLTGEMFREGINEMEEEEKRHRQKMEKRRISREKKPGNHLNHEHKQKPLGE